MPATRPAIHLLGAIRRVRSRRSQRGFSLIETLIASVVLVLAILGHAASVITAHSMNRTTEDTAIAAQTLGRFVERLRADPDWAGLYARLRALSAESASDAGLSNLGADPALACYAATSYYADFTVPSALGSATFLVQVPSLAVSGTSALRESAVAPRYGLPYDLNGDGVVDSASRDADYVKLPMVARIRWKRATGDSKEFVLATWLRGER
jgi:prepilin-type N-terminal cleavage/methylation domain-containing protein